VRTPFLHPNLAELAAQLPGSAHASAAGKTILRRILPRPLRSASLRRKRGFEVPIAEWLRGSLRELLLGASASATLYDEGWLDRGAVSALVRDHLEHGRDRSAALWPIVCLASWQGGPVARQPSG